MSDKKNESKNISTFEKIVEESDQKGTLSYAAARLMKDFTNDQKEVAMKRAEGLSGFVDRLKELLESLEEEPEDG
mgnify:CR=1 FL=1